MQLIKQKYYKLRRSSWNLISKYRKCCKESINNKCISRVKSGSSDFLFLEGKESDYNKKYETQGHQTTRQKKDAEFFPIF